jgi:hypothetical protein
VIVDEAQDLGSNYIHAIAALMRGTYIDCVLIGDKLQSIWGGDNMYTYLEEHMLPHTNTIYDVGENVVRRFHNSMFIDFVNSIIPFEKYGLPCISGVCSDTHCKYSHDETETPYHIFPQKPVYSNDKDNQKIYSLMKVIIGHMENEIERHGYVPRNFMMIFPFMRNNTLGAFLVTRLQEFWMNMFQDHEYQDKVLSKDPYWSTRIEEVKSGNFFQFSFMHMSDENKPINLIESEQATRLLSIHASKGQGCEVVFVLNMTEDSLRVFGRGSNDDLQYDSLWHVSVTRQKKSLYIGYCNNNDDICRRLQKISPELVSLQTKIPNISKYTKVSHIDDYIKTYKWIEFKQSNCINLVQQPSNETGDNDTMEWGNHIIRYCTTFYQLLFNIVKDESHENDDMRNLRTRLFQLIQSDIVTLQYTEYYDMLHKMYEIKKTGDSMRKLPILLYNDNQLDSKYKKYANIVHSMINNIIYKLNIYLNSDELPPLCPLETIVFAYMIHVQDYGKYNDVIMIQQVYDILHSYDQSACTHNDIKCRCKCSDLFEYPNMKGYNRSSDIHVNIKRHFEVVSTVKEKYHCFINHIRHELEDDGIITHNIFHNLQFIGQNKEFVVTKFGVHIAFTNRNVFVMKIKPSVSALNINDILTELATTTFLITHDKRFEKKNVYHCIFTYSSDAPIWLNANMENEHIKFLQNVIKDALYMKYANLNEKVMQVFDNIKHNRVTEKCTKIKQNSFQIMLEQLNNLPMIPSYCFAFFEKYEKESKAARRCVLNDGDVTPINMYLQERLDNWLDETDEYDF